MTTIAYRDGILAADTQVCGGGGRAGTVVKVVRRSDGHLAGTAGDLSWAQRLHGWFMGGENGEPPLPKEGGGEAILIRPDGGVHYVDEVRTHTLKADCHASGSGSQFALGAMAAGATAERAVEIACSLDIHTGGEVTVVKLEG